MSLTGTDRESLLSQWIKPSSNSEQERQERAVRMIKDAIKAHSAFDGVNIAIYAKGSYANNTNVRKDSDVDIVVECRECYYYDFDPRVTLSDRASARQSISPYRGKWTADVWRTEVVSAVKNKFGEAGVDISGNIAINISEVAGSRPSADVVPSFEHRRFLCADIANLCPGSHVVGKDGAEVVNWPIQQLENGRRKNTRTGGRYKHMVRALKNIENVLVNHGLLQDLPSYLMECLVYNVADGTLKAGSLDDAFQGVLLELAAPLASTNGTDHWMEPNEIKHLFSEQQKWTTEDARRLICTSLQFMGYLD
ncbi:hypothetical protein AB0K67_25260 [Nonomuraea sp. NPDC052634]|jgi:hypothetical protein|uniref:hypothetical protein n=1 Tax=Nonomuraea sp. NPDC052634 TaxID=3155813 RepID=UPI003414749E